MGTLHALRLVFVVLLLSFAVLAVFVARNKS